MRRSPEGWFRVIRETNPNCPPEAATMASLADAAIDIIVRKSCGEISKRTWRVYKAALGYVMENFIREREGFNPPAPQKGVVSENGKNRTLSRLPRSYRPELARAYLGAAAPEVIAGQVDVLPAKRRQVLQQRIIDDMAVAT